jgi:hypothetical protein
MIKTKTNLEKNCHDTYFYVLSQNLHEGTEKTMKNHSEEWRIDQGPQIYDAGVPNHSKAMFGMILVVGISWKDHDIKGY